MIRIQPAESCDVPDLEELERIALSPGWTASQLLDGLAEDSSLYLAARSEDRLIGYVAFRWVVDEAELLRLAVLPDYRRRGVASRLLHEAENQLTRRGVRQCYLEVRADNLGATSFYRRRGWIESGRRRQYYPDGDDALVLNLTL